MKNPMSIYWPIQDKAVAFRSIFAETLRSGIGRGGAKIIHERGTGMQCIVTERTVRVCVGLNEVARQLNVSRGHLSLVVHGKRQSKRLVVRLINECGFKPKELDMVKRSVGLKVVMRQRNRGEKVAV